MTEETMQINPRNHPTLVGVDDEVLARLTAEAVPFIDDPNAVLRRLLQLDAAADPKTNGRTEAPDQAGTRKPSVPRKPRSGRSRATRSRPPRAPKGSLTPEDAFELPILEVLSELSDGQLPSRDVTRSVGERMREVLNEHDQFVDEAGVSRWEKRVPFVRMRLVERGMLSKQAPRGVWEITDQGREFVGAARK
jgi:hypothetical protein